MSTSLLVQKMMDYVKASGFDIQIDSAGSELIEEKITDYEVILVGPQIRHRYSRLEEMAKEKNKKIGLIDQKVYGLIDGKGAVEQAIKLNEGGQ